MARGAHVVMACRDTASCEAAVADIRKAGGSGTCECAKLDLADVSSVRAFAAALAQQLGQRKLAVLVNNAGGQELALARSLHCAAPMAVTIVCNDTEYA